MLDVTGPGLDAGVALAIEGDAQAGTVGGAGVFYSDLRRLGGRHSGDKQSEMKEHSR